MYNTEITQVVNFNTQFFEITVSTSLFGVNNSILITASNKINCKTYDKLRLYKTIFFFY